MPCSVTESPGNSRSTPGPASRRCSGSCCCCCRCGGLPPARPCRCCASAAAGSENVSARIKTRDAKTFIRAIVRSLQLDVALDIKAQIQPFNPDRRFGQQRFVALEAAVRKRIAHGQLDLALRCNADLLEKFTHRGVKHFLVHSFLLRQARKASLPVLWR